MINDLQELKLSIKNFVVDAFNSIYKIDINIDDVLLQPTNDNFPGSYTIVLHSYLKQYKISCNQIGDFIKTNSNFIKEYNVVGGFLNLVIDSQCLLSCLKSYNTDFTYDVSNETVLVEYASPNTNKPLHLGHLRNIFLGHSMSNILKAIGYDVKQVNLVNDRGIHICKSMIAYHQKGNNETPESIHMKGDHFVGKYYVEFDKIYKQQKAEMSDDNHEPSIMIQAQEMLQKWENNDIEVRNLWKKMNNWVYDGFNQTYECLGIHFDKIYYESQTYLLGKKIVQEGLSKNIFYKKDDDSIWIDLIDLGLDNKLLLRKDGTSVYITQDLGTIDLRYNEYKFQKMIYVVGNEQEYHFKVLKGITKKLGYSYSDEIYHLSYGMVELPSGKMKSREGTVVDADDIIQEMIDKTKQKFKELGKNIIDESIIKNIGLGALIFYLLKVEASKNILFDPNKSVDFKGDTSIFIQYTYVRTLSLLRTIDFKYEEIYQNIIDLEEIEEKIIIILLEYKSAILNTAKNYSPSILAQYLLKLSRLYSKLYDAYPILNEENLEKRSLRLKITDLTNYTIKNSLNLLGIKVITYM